MWVITGCHELHHNFKCHLFSLVWRVVEDRSHTQDNQAWVIHPKWCFLCLCWMDWHPWMPASMKATQKRNHFSKKYKYLNTQYNLQEFLWIYRGYGSWMHWLISLQITSWLPAINTTPSQDVLTNWCFSKKKTSATSSNVQS